MLQPHRLINLGERGAPLNGAIWVESGEWTLAAKMKSDFDEATLAQLDRAMDGRVVLLTSAMPPLHAVAMAGGETVDGAATGNRHADKALSTAAVSTDNAFTRTTARVDRAIAHAARSVRHSLAGR